eukprot:3636859-Lingulodinium_polyedra.AAC.1
MGSLPHRGPPRSGILVGRCQAPGGGLGHPFRRRGRRFLRRHDADGVTPAPIRGALFQFQWPEP